MFRQVKSALFWYYLYKFRKRVIFICFLLIIALFANSIYTDIVEYLKLKERLEFLELALLMKWGIIIFNILFSIYLILTIFKNNQKKENNVKENKKEVKNHEKKTKIKSTLTPREESFLKKPKLRTKADILLDK